MNRGAVSFAGPQGDAIVRAGGLLRRHDRDALPGRLSLDRRGIADRCKIGRVRAEGF